MKPSFHIAILSVGGNLGQNILDALEGRRGNLTVTGVDMSSNNPRVFRCDKAFLAPETESTSFKDFLVDLIIKEDPDVVLPGGDRDVLVLAELAESLPEMRARIPCGTSEAARIMGNKSLSYEFAKAHSLPFAPTFVLRAGCIEDAQEWAREHGFPSLAKPERGYGSLGIRYLLDQEDLEEFIGRHENGYVLQKVLDFDEARRRFAEEYLKEEGAGIPFFMHLPDDKQFAGQVLIRPDGSVGEVFTSCNTLVIGRVERSERLEDPELRSVTEEFARAMAAKGWRGMFNLQCRRTGSGYVAHEMNGRMTGSTSARRLLGYDEVRLLIKAFCNHDIGTGDFDAQPVPGFVCRTITDCFVSQRDYEDLSREGVWQSRP